MKSVLSLVILCVLVASCQTLSPEEEARRKAEAELLRANVNQYFDIFLPEFASFCMARAEGLEPSDQLLLATGLQKKKALGTHYYTKSWTVGDRSRIMNIHIPKWGCSVDIPGYAQLPGKIRAAWVNELEANGYHVGESEKQNAAVQSILSEAVFGSTIIKDHVQNAKKGSRLVQMSTLKVRGQYASSWTEKFQRKIQSKR